ncbi:MAG: hypothetical protein AAF485_02055 [Chloroflexota bacterium]
MGQRGKHTIFKMDNNSDSLTDYTTHLLECDGLPMTYDEIENSAFGEDHSTMKGQGDSKFSAKFKFNNTTVTLFLDESNGAIKSDDARTVQLEYGNNDAPTSGDPKVSGEYLAISYALENGKDGQRALVINFAINGGTMPAWGTV